MNRFDTTGKCIKNLTCLGVLTYLVFEISAHKIKILQKIEPPPLWASMYLTYLVIGPKLFNILYYLIDYGPVNPSLLL